jgi:hypothetical protein
MQHSVKEIAKMHSDYLKEEKIKKDLANNSKRSKLLKTSTL